MRFKIVSEIVSTEQSYVRTLDMICNVSGATRSSFVCLFCKIYRRVCLLWWDIVYGRSEKMIISWWIRTYRWARFLLVCCVFACVLVCCMINKYSSCSCASFAPMPRFDPRTSTASLPTSSRFSVTDVCLFVSLEQSLTVWSFLCCHHHRRSLVWFSIDT